MENINEIVKEAVLLAIREYDKANIEKSKRKTLYNTKLLLKNYNELNNHAKNAVYKHTDERITDNINKIDANYSDDFILIESIKNSRIKTLIYIDHMNMALERVKRNQKVKGTYEKYEALEMFYIDKERKEDIAIKINCSSKSVGRWIREMEEEVGINLFGINSIEGALY